MHKQMVLVSGYLFLVLFSASMAFSEVATDGTLGREVSLSGPNYRIAAELGIQKGDNLFHSFSRFSLDFQESATFMDAVSGDIPIRNVISRITGGYPSSIDGGIRCAIPDADIYLMNPNGLLFGPNASVDVGGSFYGITADYIRFSDETRFHAAPEKPVTLSVSSPRAFGFLDNPRGKITINAKGEESAGEGKENQPIITAGKTLFLSGKEIEIKGSEAEKGENTIQGEKIILCAGAENSEISAATGEYLSRDPGEGGIVSVSGQALVSAQTRSGARSPAIRIHGGKFFLDGSEIRADADDTASGGGIDILAGETNISNGSTVSSCAYGTRDAGSVSIKGLVVRLSGENGAGSRIVTSSFGEDTESGDAGNVEITAQEVMFENGSYISTESWGKGNAGTVSVRSTGDIGFSGQDAFGFASGIIALGSGFDEDAGDGGGITMEGENLILSDGAAFATSATGGGNAGDIRVSLSKNLLLEGNDDSGAGSRMIASAESDYSGGAGNITVHANNIFLRDGAWIDSTAFGTGKGGDIRISAEETISFSGVDGGGQGSGVIARTDGYAQDAGDAGNIFITAKALEFQDGAWTGSTSSGGGAGGEVFIRVDNGISFSGTDGNGYAGRIYTTALGEEDYAGDAGNITIHAGSLLFQDGGGITAGTWGPGRGGDIRVVCENEILFSGVNPHGENRDGFGTGLYARSLAETGGDAGDIHISGKSLEMTEGAVITSTTKGMGNGGMVYLDMQEGITISGTSDVVSLSEPLDSQLDFAGENPDAAGFAGSGIYSRSALWDPDSGHSGDVTITGGAFLLKDGARISTESEGGGRAGRVDIISGTSLDIEGKGSGIFATSYGEEFDSGDAGEISLAGKNIRISSGAGIGNASWGGGKGGDITLVAAQEVRISGYDEEGRDTAVETVALGYEEDAGDAGNIRIAAERFFLEKGARLESASYGGGEGGDLFINAQETVTLSGTGESGRGTRIFVSADDSISGDAGEVHISAGDIVLEDGALIDSSTYGEGNGGNITLNATGRVDFTGKDGDGMGSGMVARADGPDEYAGDGGDVTISAENVHFKEGAWIGNTSSGGGDGGHVRVLAKKEILFSGVDGDGYSSRIYTNTLSEESYAGKAGNIEMDSRIIRITQGGGITAGTFGAGTGGKIEVKAQDRLEISGVNPRGMNRDGFQSGIFARSEGKSSGKGGEIGVRAGNLTLEKGGTISTSTFGNGEGGSISIEVDNEILANGNGKNGATLPPLESQEAFLENDPDKAEALMDDPFASGVESRSESTEETAGNAGAIAISAGRAIHVKNRAAVTTRAKTAGGGSISLFSGNLFHAKAAEVTTSVLKSTGNGGDVRISSPYTVLNDSRVIAQAYLGNGGNISIKGNHIIRSPYSVVDASSQLGIDGSVDIQAPDVDVAGGLSVLPSDFLDASRWLATPCKTRTGQEAGSFVIQPPLPGFLPDEYLSSPLLVEISPSMEGAFAEALSLYRKGKIKDAVLIWEEKKQEAALSGQARMILFTCLGKAYTELGRYPDAIHAFDAVFPVKWRSGHEKIHADTWEKVMYLTHLGHLLTLLGHPKEGLVALERAETGATAQRSPLLLAGVLNNRASALYATGSITDCIAAISEGNEVADSVSDPFFRKSLNMVFQVNRFRVDWKERRIDHFPAAFIQVMESLSEMDKGYIPNKGLLCMADSLNRFLEENKGTETARTRDALFVGSGLSDALEDCAGRAEKTGRHRMASLATGMQAILLENLGEPEKARFAYTRALYLSDKGGYPELSYRWEWGLGRIFAFTGNRQRAIGRYRKAVENLNPVRNFLMQGETVFGNRFARQLRPVYLELAGLYLEKAETGVTDDEKQKFLSLARDAVETLKNAELEDFFDDACVTGKTGVREKQADALIQSAGTVILYPILLKDRLFLLLTTDKGIHQYRVDIPLEEIEKLARRLRMHLQNPDDMRCYAYARKLYNILVLPWAKSLPEKAYETLVVAPDGALRLVPFSALHDGTRFLVEYVQVVTIPGISMTDAKTGGVLRKTPLISGLSVARLGFSALSNVEKEVAEIQSIMGGTALTNQAYTRENLVEKFKARSYEIIHLATHGQFGRSAEDTFLLTYDGKLNMNDLENLVDMGRFREEPLELLTLSACQTAVGDERSALGLAGVAVKAGARSAVASLWFVDDRATYETLTAFYQNIQEKKMNRAKALQAAQVRVKNMPDFSHPAYWSPFLLIGSWE